MEATRRDNCEPLHFFEVPSFGYSLEANLPPDDDPTPTTWEPIAIVHPFDKEVQE